MAKSETEASNKTEVTADFSVKFPDGQILDFIKSGEMKGDLDTGAFSIEGPKGKVIFLPNLDDPKFTGRRKRRLKALYNL